MRSFGHMYRTALLAPLTLALSLGCSATLETGLPEPQADAVVVALHAEGIGAEKSLSAGSEGLFEVEVAASEVGRALRVMRDAGLPSAPEPGLHDVFGAGGLVPTATEERARYAAAVAGELARSLERIDGVLDARVHVAVPERALAQLDARAPKPRASVLIRRRAGAAVVDPEDVARLVVGAVPGMALEDVMVVDVEAPAPLDAALSLVQIGPVSVTRGTASALRGLLLSGLAGYVVLALVLIALARASRARSGELSDLRAQLAES